MRTGFGSRGRLLLGRLSAVAAALLGAAYLVWRAGTLQSTGAVGAVFFAAEVSSYLALLLTAAVLWRARAWRLRAWRRPAGSVDILVTVCGEPPRMVEQTLRAALAVRGQHGTYVLNDSRLAGVRDWKEIERIAARYGVPCITRTTGPRSKAANLNSGLQHSTAEFVITLDADHIAEPSLLDDLLGYFADPTVAFVATRQRFRQADRDVLNNAEPLFYDALQWAKDADGAAFSCGNGTAYRRFALTTIGGFSQWNIVEDLHTSYLLHDIGWRSVYHGRAISTGTAPHTAATFLAQRRRWAMDSLRLLLWDSPLFRGGLRPVQRLHYLHTTTSYLFAIPQLVFALGPPLAVLGGVQLMRVDTTSSYLLHAVPYLVSVVLFLSIYCGPVGAFRTVQSSLFTAPTYLLAALRVLRRRRPASGATRKAGERRIALALLPAFCLAVLQAATLVTVIRGGGGSSPVAATWAALLLCLILGPLSSAISGVRLRCAARLSLRFATAAAVGVTLFLGQSSLGRPARSLAETAAGSAGDAVVTSRNSASSAARITQRLLPPRNGRYLGVSSAELDSGASLASYARRNVRPHIVMWFQQWGSGETRFRADWLNRIANQGAIPMITWEPWSKPKGSYVAPDQQAARLAVLASGRYDRYVTAWARAAAAHRRPILLRFMHEMNGNWYPWSVTTNGNTPALYKKAWRHVHDIFTAAGARNVSWVWSLNTTSGLSVDGPAMSTYYPGSRYVDWVAISGMNWGDTSWWSRWISSRTIFNNSLRRISAFRKPIMISEVATVADGGDPTAWTRGFLQFLTQAAEPVRAVVWFDHDYSPKVHFRLRPGAAALLRKATSSGDFAVPISVAAAAPGAATSLKP